MVLLTGQEHKVSCDLPARNRVLAVRDCVPWIKCTWCGQRRGEQITDFVFLAYLIRKDSQVLYVAMDFLNKNKSSWSTWWDFACDFGAATWRTTAYTTLLFLFLFAAEDDATGNHKYNRTIWVRHNSFYLVHMRSLILIARSEIMGSFAFMAWMKKE